MTRIPQLEQELVAAAARRPRRSWRLSARVLVPAVAAVLLAVALVRIDDPEVEAPAGQGTAALDGLRAGPLADAVAGADPRFAPVSLAAGPWTVAAFANRDGNACMAAATAADPSSERGCSSAGLLAAGLERDRSVMFEVAGSGDSRLVFGLAGAGVRIVDIEVGGAKRRALVGPPFTTEVTEEERRAVEPDGGEVPPAGPVRFRLFAATFTAREVRDPDAARTRFSLIYEDGSRATTGLLGVLNDGGDPVPPAGCFEEADLEADTAIPAGAGDPVEVCERFWEETGFEGTPAPEQLTACEGDAEAVAPWVFPGGPEVCGQLGLRPYNGSNARAEGAGLGEDGGGTGG